VEIEDIRDGNADRFVFHDVKQKAKSPASRSQPGLYDYR
jgi:hypothetical protein